MRYIIILVIIAVGVFDAASHTVESQLYVDNLSLEDGLSINALFYDVDTDKLWIGSKKGLTGISSNEFIRHIRLKRGKELLMEGCNVSEAAYSCGFNDVGYFRNCFKDEYGMSPSQFIKEKVKQNQV